MSRMTNPIDLTQRSNAEALDATHMHRTSQAAAIVAVADEMRKLRQDMETRWTALETHVNSVVGAMDGSMTGLHQDVANLILRMQTVTRWLAARFPEFPEQAETTLKQLIADMNTEAAKYAQEEETKPDDQSGEDPVSV